MSFRTLNMVPLVRMGCTLIITETFLDVVCCRWSRPYITIRRDLGRVSGMDVYNIRNWMRWCKVVVYYQPSQDMFVKLNDLMYLSILTELSNKTNSSILVFDCYFICIKYLKASSPLTDWETTKWARETVKTGQKHKTGGRGRGGPTQRINQWQ